MDCWNCGTTYPKDFWKCSACGHLNYRRLGWWAGLILVPWVFLALVAFRGQVLFMLGLSRDISNAGDFWPIGLFFPFAGLPFIWFGQGDWKRKLWLSVIYVVFYYFFTFVAYIGTIVWAVSFMGRG